MFRSSWGWTTPATQAEFDFAWLARDWISNSSSHPGRPRSNTLLGDWAGVKALTNGHPSCNSKLPETTPEDLNLSQALQFTLREVFLIFNLHSIMSYRRSACNCPKTTEPQYNTFSKPSTLTAGKKKGGKKGKRSVQVTSQSKILPEWGNPPTILYTNFQKSASDTLESLHLFWIMSYWHLRPWVFRAKHWQGPSSPMAGR